MNSELHLDAQRVNLEVYIEILLALLENKDGINVEIKYFGGSD